MAHEVETMAYAGELPWHGLGEAVSNDLTPAQMMDKARLNWGVEKQDMFTADGLKIPGRQALIRTSDNSVLDVVGNDWNPIQNEEAFEFFSEYVLAGDMEMHTAGSLMEGRKVWVLAKVKESFTILGSDRIDSYLLFSNPHQYGRSIDVRFTPIRVVCNNTLTMSLGMGSNNQVKLNHRSKFDPEDVKAQLGIAHTKFDNYRQLAEHLSSKPFTAENLIQYYNEVFPHTYSKGKTVEKEEDLSRTAKRALEVLDTQPGAEFGKGTWWQAANAVSYLTDHELGRTVDTRMTSAWFGPNAQKKQKAFNLASDYADAA